MSLVKNVARSVGIPLFRGTPAVGFRKVSDTNVLFDALDEAVERIRADRDEQHTKFEDLMIHYTAEVQEKNRLTAQLDQVCAERDDALRQLAAYKMLERINKLDLSASDRELVAKELTGANGEATK